YLIALTNIDREIMLGDEKASARVDVERARVDFVGIGVLDRLRLAGRLIDCIGDDTVLAAFEHLLALKLERFLGAIGAIGKPADRMHMPRPRRLTCADVI